MPPQVTGAGGYLQEGRSCVAGNDGRRRAMSGQAVPALVDGLRLNRDPRGRCGVVQTLVTQLFAFEGAVSKA